MIFLFKAMEMLQMRDDAVAAAATASANGPAKVIIYINNNIKVDERVKKL